MDYNVLKALTENEQGQMALATIVKVSGSAPRHEGTQMLVREDGSTTGTLGGGCGEDRVRMGALHVIEERKSQNIRVTLNDDIAVREGMICGGTMETFVEYLEDISFYEEAVRLVEEGKTALLVTDMDEPSRKGLYLADGSLHMGEGFSLEEDIGRLIRGSRLKLKDRLILVPVLPSEKLLVLGGGHVALPIVQLGKNLDFEVTVVDDRPEFASPERFPEADQVICGPFAKVLKEYPLDENTYVVLVTRGHTWDGICLKAILDRPWKYIGMIGSKRRVITLLSNLEEKGFDPERLDRIHSPIGLDIGSETPEEVAVSIMAEVIAVRRGKDDSFRRAPLPRKRKREKKE